MMVLKGLARGAWIAALTASFGVASARAAVPQSETSPAAIPSEIAIPDEPDAIALRPRRRGALPEQWERQDSAPRHRQVRNVVDPFLVPVLPDPGRANGAAVVIAPGGAFRHLAMDSEGFLVARFLADHGIAAFVLKYRTVPGPRDRGEFSRWVDAFLTGEGRDPSQTPAPPFAVEDARAALRLVRARAARFHVDPARIGFLGFSAGAFLTLDVGLAADPAARPDFIAPIYGPMWERRVPADAPPMFLAIALDDPLFAAGRPLGIIESYRRAQRPLEVHLFERGGHGFGLGPRGSAAGSWSHALIAWLRDRRIIPAAAD